MNSGPTTNQRYNGETVGAPWQHDLYDQHEKTFTGPSYSSQNSGSTGNFSSVNGNTHKSKNTYYSKKPVDQVKQKLNNPGSSRSNRDSDKAEIRYVLLDKGCLKI